MAGATAEILLPDLPAEALASWESTVAALSTVREGNDFWVPPLEGNREVPLPFFWNTRHDRGDGWMFEGAQDGVTVVRETFGFTPRASIAFGAMCRGRPSDRILARLASMFLAGREGALLFDGLLAPSLEDPAWRAWYDSSADERAARFIQALGPFVGRIVAVPIDGEPRHHAVDLPFLDFWQGHPAFHFVN